MTNDLSTDQRVAKVCSTLHNAGFDILLIGRKLKHSQPLNRNYKTKRIQLLFNKGFLFYAEYNFRLFLFLFFSSKDILLSNDTDTLLANYLVGKIQSKKLVFDSHELFSEIPELVERPFVKRCWLQLEKWMIPKLKNSYTVSNSIANYYKKLYNSDFKVIKNLPLKQQVTTSSFPFETSDKKIILYQGAVNIDRGLELMIDSMQHLNNHLFIIIGDGDILQELKQLVHEKKLHNKVYFLGKLLPEMLKKLTPLADIGISLEEDAGLNYRFSLPNKVFDYIQADVPIFVSDLPEMKQLIIDYQVGETVRERKPKEIATQMNQLLAKDYSIQLSKAKEEFIWEKQEEVLLSIFKN